MDYKDKEILKWATLDSGWTVAHEQARRGWITTDPEILSLTDKNGNTVYEIILSYWNRVAQGSKKDLLNENFNSPLSIISMERELFKEKNLKNKYKYLFEYINTKTEELFKQKICQRIDNLVMKYLNKKLSDRKIRK